MISSTQLPSILILLAITLAAAVSPDKGMILRIRLSDGSMEKVQVPRGAEESMTLSDLLNPFQVDEESSTVQFGSDKIDPKKTLSELGAKHGSMITIQSTNSKPKPTESRFAKMKPAKREWDPFPDLARDHGTALLKVKTRRASSNGMSYDDISRLQSSLHVVEPQPEGKLKRVYMCARSAERFHANGLLKKTGGVQCRVGLLLGTIQKERVDKKPRKARTSLSSQTSDAEFCTVAKVQAVWEPSGQTTSSGKIYDDSIASSMLSKNSRVLAIAEKLGLQPVGWIFSHVDDRHGDDEDSLPVYDMDLSCGSQLQISKMRNDSEDGSKFVTLSMDANIGATEAFQLSDICVQMVHESMIVTKPGTSKKQITTHHPVVVDGRETTQVDSVLCLVNTAMLSHTGTFSGKTAAGAVKKNGNLTNKTKKTLLKLLEDGKDSKLLEELCDFNTILALDQLVTEEESDKICEVVWKWSRGQKQGTKLGSKLKKQLRNLLEV
ncbi:unnamed protein product [Cylindrotheca closterium]|uniref:Nuclear pore localisation protein NPL4 C-terminal domain-containing protein n=1 Tax=Cylindrotheca closterium TaxID=2856 RepID=A0AAD2CB78_9STRA|nr:unnamed protein product [Cylindrotheca closterium]